MCKPGYCNTQKSDTFDEFNAKLATYMAVIHIIIGGSLGVLIVIVFSTSGVYLNSQIIAECLFSICVSTLFKLFHIIMN